MKNNNKLAYLILILTTISVSAQINYLTELSPLIKSTFKHWDLNRLEITGYSYFSYEELYKSSKKFIVEKNENTKSDGNIFTRKILGFGKNSGILEWYEEEDLRENMRIRNTYLGNIVRTRLEKMEKVLEFETNLNDENTIPFEVVIYFLRKKLPLILEKKDFSFTLFLPLLAIELEEKGLARSMSMIKMMVKPLEELIQETPLGKIKAHKILVLPKSGLLRTLLPREKTHFEFTIAEAVPHYLLEFTAGKTRHILTKISFSK